MFALMRTLRASTAMPKALRTIPDLANANQIGMSDDTLSDDPLSDDTLSDCDELLPISVLMSVYNSQAYLQAAIDSVLQQTFREFEFVIIDDCSTDGSWEILTAYAAQDRRIRLRRNRENLGLTRSLNQGLAEIRGKYVARMDADDVSLPDRFARQYQFMEANPAVGVCGTWTKTIGEGTRHVALGYVNQYPADDKTIRCWLLFGVGLAHPSVFLRRELLLKAGLTYDNSYRCCQDYDLWTRAYRHFELANLPEVLLLYRLHPQQVGQAYSADLRLLNNRRVWLNLFEQLGLVPTEAELALHQSIYQWNFQSTRSYIEAAERWLSKILQANAKTLIYDPLALAKFLGDRWFVLCYAATGLGFWVWWRFLRSHLTTATDLPWQHRLKFPIKCGIASLRWVKGSFEF